MLGAILSTLAGTAAKAMGAAKTGNVLTSLGAGETTIGKLAGDGLASALGGGETAGTFGKIVGGALDMSPLGGAVNSPAGSFGQLAVGAGAALAGSSGEKEKEEAPVPAVRTETVNDAGTKAVPRYYGAFGAAPPVTRQPEAKAPAPALDPKAYFNELLNRYR